MTTRRPPTRRPPTRLLLAGIVAVLVAACAIPAPGTWVAALPLTRGQAPVTIEPSKIACGSPTHCLALPQNGPGGYGPGPAGFGERWDGTAWSPVPRPPIEIRTLACASSWCLANGYATDTGPGATFTWNGSAWSPVAGSVTVQAGELTCLASDFCVAIGSTGDGGTAARWDGTRWTTITGTRTATTNLDAVACATRTECVFMTRSGSSSPVGMERWDGATWSVMPIAGSTPKGGDVACGPTLTTCFYAGTWTDGGTERIAIMRWNGTTWAPDPFRPADFVDHLSCHADGSCLAFTSREILVFDGTRWAAGPALPNDRSFTACTSRTFCAAIAERRSAPPGTPPSFLMFDGAGWMPVTAAPNPLEARAALVTVSCPAPDRCVAIGHYADGATTRPLVEIWDGRAWRLGPDLPVPAGGAVVDVKTLTCATAVDCLAVGSKPSSAAAPAGLPAPYLAHFDGRRWTDESAGIAALAPISLLLDAWCNPSNPSTCIAVGFSESRVVAFVDTGAGWQPMPAPPTGQGLAAPGRTALQIDCASPTACAVSSLIVIDVVRTVASYWDGTTWSDPTTTNGSPPGTALTGVACSAVGRCFVTGAGQAGDHVGGVIMEWTGASWISQATPSPLGAVACTAADRCVAVGDRLGSPDGSGLATAMVREDGAWHPMTRTAPSIEPDTVLGDIACRGDRCLTVGFTTTSPVAYRWAF